MIYISSDLHLCHNKEFIWKERGFNSVEEMNLAIINNFNSILTNDDILYLLGDCCMGRNEEAIPLLAQIKGRKYLAIGNHDTDARLNDYIKYNIFEDIQFGYRIKNGKSWFILTHYPTYVSNTSGEKVWNLHGHTHQKHCFEAVLQCYHVGIDSHNCYPISINTIREEIKHGTEN